MPHESKTLENELLAIRCQLGEPAAFDELVAKWHSPLWLYVRKMAGRDDLGDELAQETWLRILRGIAKLRDPASLVPWMFGIARRVLMDRLRQKYSERIVNENALVEVSAVADQALDRRREEIAEMLQRLENLPPAQREILILYYLDELSVGEVGQVLEIPPGTVKSRLHHARRALKNFLLEKQ